MKRKLLMSLVCAAAGLAAWATADYYQIDGTTLTITVPPNVTESFDTAFLANVTENAVTDIAKDGDGTLVMNQDISAYTGTIHINHGIWVLTDANSLGSTASGAGGVFVADGATLENQATRSTVLNWKPISFEGNGFGGRGALYVNATATQGSSTWGKTMTMTGDAFMNANHDNYVSFYSSNSARLDMGGHTLYVNGGTRNGTGGKSYVVFYYVTISTPGSIIVTNNTQFIIQSVGWWNGNADNRLVFRDMATLSTGSGGIRGNWLWTLEWDSNGTNLYYRIPNKETYPNDTRNLWRGPVELKKSMHVVLADERYSDTVSSGIDFSGVVSGVGGFDFIGGPSRASFATLSNPTNSFAGGISASDITLNLLAGGALPQGGEPLRMTDANLVFTNTFYSLPTGFITTASSCAVSNGVGRWAHLVKDGEGPLDYASCVGAETLEVKSGSVKIPAAQTQSWMAGLVEGVGYYRGADAIKDKTTGEITYRGSQTDLQDDYVYRQRIVTYPSHLYTSHVDPMRHTQSWDTGAEAKRYLITYSGYIWNRTNAPVTWTFAGNVSSWLRLKIDGQQVFDMTNTKITGRGTVTLDPGPHTIYIVNECKINDGGIQNSSTNMTWNKLGLRYDPQGRDSTNGVDYVVLEDPGDGSLLTWCLPGESAEWPVDNAYLDREIVVADPAGERGTVSSVPVFRTIAAIAGTSVDFSGGTYAVDTLKGFPTLMSCTGFSVTNKWIVSAAAAAAGGKLSGAPLAFGDDVDLVVEDDRETHQSFEAEIARSTTAITGGLSIKDAALGRIYRVVIEDDKVMLQRLPKGLCIGFK